jgi:hypothetical protein
VILLIVLISRLLLGAILLFSGAAKVVAGTDFRRQWLAGYQIIPGPVAEPVALIISIGELGAGAMLFLGAFGQISALVALVALGSVSAIVVTVLLSKLRPSCGCFGRFTNDAVSWRLVGRNAALMAIALTLYRLNSTSVGLSRASFLFQVFAVGATAVACLGIVYALSARSRARSIETPSATTLAPTVTHGGIEA